MLPGEAFLLSLHNSLRKEPYILQSFLQSFLHFLREKNIFLFVVFVYNICITRTKQIFAGQ